MKRKLLYILLISTIILACEPVNNENQVEDSEVSELDMKLNEYASFKLTSDLSILSDNQLKMLPILLEAAQIMNDLFWKEAYGNRESGQP